MEVLLLDLIVGGADEVEQTYKRLKIQAFSTIEEMIDSSKVNLVLC